MNRKNLYRQIATITLPIVIQNVLDSAINMADIVMLNAVGQDSMSAASLAAHAVNIMFMFLFGIGSAMTMVGAQYWGKNDLPAIEKAQGIALRYTLIISTFAAAFCMFVPSLCMKLFTSDPVLISLGATYLRIFSPAIVLWGISSVFLATLRGTGRVKICTVLEAVALVMNIVLNAVFLFVFKMGVAGVAITTLLSRVVEFILCILISVRSKTVKLNFKPVFEKHPALEADFRRICLPAIGNDLSWGLAYAMYSVILGHMNSDAVAAHSFVEVIRNLGCVFCGGLGSATAVILGQILGTGDRDGAVKVSHILLRLSVVAGVLAGAIIGLFIPLLVPRANLTEAAREYLKFMLTVNVFYVMGRAVNTCLITGVFRAGGDTRFGFLCDTIDMWVYAVPLGFLAAFVFKLDVKIVYLLLCTDEFVKWPWVFRHYYQYGWAKNITRENLDQQTI